MELVRGDHNIRPRHRGGVTALGGFDGLHLGHQAIIRRTAQVARRCSRSVGIVLFEPLPHEFLKPFLSVPRLYPLRERIGIIASLGVDHVTCLRFDARMASMSPEDFVREILIDRLRVHTLLVGRGFRFGRERAGGVAELEVAASQHGFALECVDTVFSDDAERISSTRVRAVLARGELALASRLLGRDYCVSGRVGHGDRRGGTLGFSTANVLFGRRRLPLRGVFAVAVEGVDGREWRGVANAGYRPTFGTGGYRLEVHLPGFSGDLYGRHLRVRFLARIRDERCFGSLDALKKRIQEDIRVAAGMSARISETAPAG